MRPEAVCGLLAEEERLAVFAAVVLGAASPSAVAAATGLPAREVVRALRRLEQGGLIDSAGGRLAADRAAFKDAVREAGPESAAEDPMDPDRVKSGVLRAFVRDGRLVAIPAARGKRRIVLEHIAACFEPGIKYPERAVDAILRAWHEDYVSLRRYLIDEELMDRDQGIYWRVGGPVEVD